MKHVMLDLETVGTKPYSAIIGIGAAYFDPRGSSILDSFHVTVDLALAQKRGFRLDAGAVAWWLAPAQRPAWDAYLNIAHFSPDDAFNGFGQWLDTVGDREDIAFWGNGAGFDCNLMHNAADLMGLGYTNKDGNPRDGLWPYSNDRCFRTMKNIVHTMDVPNEDHGVHRETITARSLCPPDVGIAHVAVDDAIHQAQWLQAICNTFDINP